MRRTQDKISEKILEILKKAEEPLETKDIEDILEKVTRVKVLYRLNMLRGDAKVKGKPVGSGKGTWIWWRKDVFK